MERRLFTPIEDEYIITNYPTMLLRDIGRALTRPWTIVQQRAVILERQGRLDRKVRAYHRNWTAEEDDYLSDHWGLLPDRVVARHLNRSVDACKIRTTRHHGIGRKASFYTARNVADIFGVDVHLVVGKWIAIGLLAARKSCVRCGGGGLAWQIDEEAITQFAQRYPWHYDRKRIERGSYWRNLTEQAWQRDPWLTVGEAATELRVNPETVRRHIRRGWLRGERTWEAGKYGGYRVPRSALATFRRRKDPVTVTPALLAWYNRQTEAAS